jgi:hypothetical protein
MVSDPAAPIEDVRDKARILVSVHDLVAAGVAIWSVRATGELEVRLGSGETYVLADSAVMRVA